LIQFDRRYPPFELIKVFLEREIYFVMRVRRKFSTEIDELGYSIIPLNLSREEKRSR